MQHDSDRGRDADGGTSSETESTTTADVAGVSAGRGDPGLDPHDQSGTAVADSGEGEEQRPLLADEDLESFRRRWDEVQVGFVDEPRGAVQRADALVAELMQQLASTFADERARLESQWERGTDVSTEDLRVALQRYRSFFGRLLAA